ncbi:MAG: sulfite oxidase [Variibacter sp.]|nr:sulfite oxidase [Variibacter sp.]
MNGPAEGVAGFANAGHIVRWAPRQPNSCRGRRIKLLDYPGKDTRLVVLGERPLVAETPESLLDDETTPISRFFVRNNGLAPPGVTAPDGWEIAIDGEVERPLRLTLAELKRRFAHVTAHMVIECGGNGRSFYTPAPRGNPWTNGGVGCAAWTGVRLADVLDAAGLKPTAVFTAHYGADPDVSGDRATPSISRGVTIAKALDPGNLIAWEMNGEPLPLIHGGPVRLVVGGWPGSVSAKWLTRIWVRDRVHDGPGMGGTAYRVPASPIVPGSEDDGRRFRELEAMPMRSIITSPADGARFPAGVRELHLRGAAWAGSDAVRQVDLSIDGGATWLPAALRPPRNPYDWQRWSVALALPSDGYFEICARATDTRGVMQPHAAVNWNPQGYGANPMHCIRVVIG